MSRDRSDRWRQLTAVLVPELARLRSGLAGAYGLELAGVGAALLAPWPLKLIIDEVLPARPLPGWLQPIGPDGVTLIVVLSLTSLLLLALVGAATATSRVVMARARETLAVRLRGRLLDHLQSLPPTIRMQYRSGELVLRLVGDVDLVVKTITKVLPLVVRFGATTLATMVVMLSLATREAVLVVMLLPALCLLVLRYGPRITAAARRKRRREGEVAALAQEIVRGLPVIQALGAEAVVAGRFRRLNAESLHAGVEETRLAARLEWLLEASRGAAIALVTGGGALLVLHGQLSIGSLTVLATYVTQLLRPIDKVNDLAESLSRGLAAGERLASLLRLAPVVRDRPDALHLERCRGELTLEGVAFSYRGPDGTAVPVLHRVDLSLRPGSLTVLIGRSGAGKSTVLSLLVRLFDPDAGEIRLDGHPLPAIALRSLRAQIAIMTQDLHLLAGSLRSVLVADDRPVPAERLWQVLELVAMADFVRGLPHGLETQLGEDGLNLSGGQRQRLSLARALLLERPILLLDEPLANVDEISGRVILAALARIRRERTCLAITHGTGLLQLADQVVRLEHGRLITETDPALERQTA